MDVSKLDLVSISTVIEKSKEGGESFTESTIDLIICLCSVKQESISIPFENIRTVVKVTLGVTVKQ